MALPPPILQVNRLSKQFGAVAAVQEVSFAVYPGEVYGFLGPNGAGKTTTLGMILGLVAPSQGRIELWGQPVRPGQTRVLQRVGSLVGAPALYPHLSARQHLELWANLSQPLARQRIKEVLEQVGLTQAAHRAAGSYSTGMKQRLGLGLALLNQPGLLILDEPTNGLDPNGMKEIRDLVLQLSRQGTTVLLSSHLLNEVEQICSRLALIHRGRLVLEGRLEQLTRQHALRLRVDQPEAVTALLTPLATVRPAGTYLEVEGLEGQPLIERLVQAGHTPHEVTPIRHTLEEIFLQITSQEAPHAAASVDQ